MVVILSLILLGIGSWCFHSVPGGFCDAVVRSAVRVSIREVGYFCWFHCVDIIRVAYKILGSSSVSFATVIGFLIWLLM